MFPKAKSLKERISIFEEINTKTYTSTLVIPVKKKPKENDHGKVDPPKENYTSTLIIPVKKKLKQNEHGRVGPAKENR